MYLKCEKVLSSCITLDQLAVACKFIQLARDQLCRPEKLLLHGYFRAKAHILGFRWE